MKSCPNNLWSLPPKFPLGKSMQQDLLLLQFPTWLQSFSVEKTSSKKTHKEKGAQRHTESERQRDAVTHTHTGACGPWRAAEEEADGKWGPLSAFHIAFVWTPIQPLRGFSKILVCGWAVFLFFVHAVCLQSQLLGAEFEILATQLLDLLIDQQDSRKGQEI